MDPKCIRPGTQLKSTSDWNTLTSLSLQAQNISSLGIGDTIVLANVSFLDISYNQVKDISLIGRLFPNLVSLDVSFNNISSLSTLQVAECMETIDLKWNLLSNFLDSIFIMKSRIPKLKNLDLMCNPFMDMHKESDIQYFIYKYFPSLYKFNGETLQYDGRSFVLQESHSYSVLTYRRMFANNSLSVAWKSDRFTGDAGDLHKYLCKSDDSTLVCVSLEEEKISSFDSEMSLNNLKWLNLSKNTLSDLTFVRKMPLLEEINMCCNVLETFSFTPPITNKTVKIDLSCNYLTTLKDFQSTSFPCLKILNVSNNKLTSIHGTGGLINLSEFYASHNNIRDFDGLYPAKQWQKIKIIDFSYNPVENNSTFKQFCIFHMPSLRFFNGQAVETNELIGATQVYGVYLNQDYLLKIYTRAELGNITELTLANCSVSKVSLDPNSVQNVKSLNLSHNKITDLHWVSAFPKLITVCLSYNQVSSFSNSYVNDTDSKLEALYLDNNKITSLVPLKLYLLKNLKTLFIHNNSIRNIDTGSVDMPMFTNLILDYNKIVCITENHIARMPNLKELYLEHNSISDLSFFVAVSQLERIFIAYNRIFEIKNIVFLKHLTNLKELSLQGNPAVRLKHSISEVLLTLPNLVLLDGHSVQPAKSSTKKKLHKRLHSPKLLHL